MLQINLYLSDSHKILLYTPKLLKSTRPSLNWGLFQCAHKIPLCIIITCLISSNPAYERFCTPPLICLFCFLLFVCFLFFFYYYIMLFASQHTAQLFQNLSKRKYEQKHPLWVIISLPVELRDRLVIRSSYLTWKMLCNLDAAQGAGTFATPQALVYWSMPLFDSQTASATPTASLYLRRGRRWESLNVLSLECLTGTCSKKDQCALANQEVGKLKCRNETSHLNSLSFRKTLL